MSEVCILEIRTFFQEGWLQTEESIGKTREKPNFVYVTNAFDKRKDHLCVVYKHSKEVQSQKKKGEGKRGHEKSESKGIGKTSQETERMGFCQVESTGKVRPSVCTRGSQVGNSQRGLKKCKGMKTSINIEDRRSIKRNQRMKKR
ncbi:hypothetical protein KUTeg_023235 [Tegillarca granosa]|uniref:Uncharacterized protein n=1 Tax=Tegillarca granosa TaxID=220873 RepID=A0ABQ9E6N7_TEGGR|nr:hypothetical protein KUTeg_023235 [Tegillarca granosa]